MAAEIRTETAGYPSHPQPAKPVRSGIPFLRVTYSVLGAILGIGIILVIASLAILWYERSDNHIQAGVTVRGTPLGGMSLEDAAVMLDRSWNQRKITLTDGSSTWQTNPAFLGIWMDPAATLNQDSIIGEVGVSWAALRSHLEPAAKDLVPVVKFDPAVARSQLAQWAARQDVSARDAGLRLEDGRVTTIPPRVGRALDVQAALDQISSNPLAVLESGQLALTFQPIRPALMDVSAVAAETNTLLHLSLGGVIYDPITDEKIPWQIPAAQIAQWVSLEKDGQGYHAVFDRKALVNYLSALEKFVDLGPQRVIDQMPNPETFGDEVLAGKPPVLIAWYLPREITVQEPETLIQAGWQNGIPYWRMLKANPGVNPKALRVGQKLIIPSKSDLLPLPVVLNKRIVVSITHQNMLVYENGQQIREFVISTGIASSPTQPGVFQVQTHELNAYADIWSLWMPHWLGIYEAWPGFMNGIHGLPMLKNGVRLWANVLGSPASFGCIILNLENAEWLYNWAENGVVVEIQA